MPDKFIDCPPFLAQLLTPDLRSLAPDLDINVGSPTEAETVAMLADCRFVINDHTCLPERVLQQCPLLEAIVFLGTGASSYIDVPAAERLGIRVHTIKGYGDRSVAEHAVALMMAAGRKIAAMDRAMRFGEWTTLDGIEFGGKVLGVVGTGGIGREMVRLGNALDMTVLAWNRSGVPSDLAAESADLDDVLRRADVVSLHLALTDETKGFLDARRIALLKSDAILVNTARGGLVDEPALVEALENGAFRHAALDVFADEPLAADHALARLPNVTLSAHADFMTREASRRLLCMGFERLQAERERAPEL